MLGIFGVIFILVGGATLAVSTTMFGQIAGLILWVIAALFIVGQAIVSAIEREARRITAGPAPKADRIGPPDERVGSATIGPSGERLDPKAPAGKESLWERFKKN